MGYRFRRYGPGYGYGARIGFRRGYGAGYRRRWVSPNCDFFPDRPRGWWAMPEYQNMANPPDKAEWDSYGKPLNQDAIDYEISLIEKQIEYLQKEISLLEEEKKKLTE